MLRSSRGRLLTLGFLIFLPLLVFHRALFFGEAFLPADLLGLLYPWKAVSPADLNQTPWNVLRFDGITEFYPWRWMGAQAYHEGRIPLWNPYAFAASGGIPLIANAQSAPLYPPNLFFWLLPPALFWYAFGLTAALHLASLAAGTYCFLRSLRLRKLSSLLGSAIIALSAPVITWLALPTFLCVASWLPWLLLLIRVAYERTGTNTGRMAVMGAGAIAGTMILAGHLQMAFYGLLAASLYAIALGILALRSGTTRFVPTVGYLAAAGILALCIAAPQLLPSLELSRVSHRAGGTTSMETYAGYVSNAMPPQSLVTLIAPDFFGHPNRDNGLYLNLSHAGRPNNYAEWANYVGIAPLLLAFFALSLPWKESRLPRERSFFAVLAALSLLLSFGTPLNLPFFFLVPGYSQTGNPARSLILLAFAVAVLAAIGMDALLSDEIEVKVKQRAGLIAVVVPILLLALGLNATASITTRFLAPVNINFSAVLTRGMPGLMIGGFLLALSAAGIFVLPRLTSERRRMGAVLFLALTIADLAVWGYGYNPTVPAAQVYAVTPGIAWLQHNAKDALIAPLNRSWSISAEPPRSAILPPNGLAALGLHDVGGYDSLIPGTAKEKVRDASGEDPSPPENGNMAFIKSIEAAKNLGAKYILVPPESPDLTGEGLTVVYPGPDMAIYENPVGKTFDPSIGKTYQPTTFCLGLFLALLGVAVLIATFLAFAPTRYPQVIPIAEDSTAESDPSLNSADQ